MTTLRIKAGPYEFEAQMEETLAPKTCAKFLSLLPYRQQIIHVRWSGEGCWIPLGEFDFGLGYENYTSYPAPGEIILYPGGISETEILLAYGAVAFSSKVGQLAGNHFLTITRAAKICTALGKMCCGRARRTSYSSLKSKHRSPWTSRNSLRIIIQNSQPHREDGVREYEPYDATDRH